MEGPPRGGKAYPSSMHVCMSGSDHSASFSYGHGVQGTQVERRPLLVMGRGRGRSEARSVSQSAKLRRAYTCLHIAFSFMRARPSTACGPTRALDGMQAQARRHVCMHEQARRHAGAGRRAAPHRPVCGLFVPPNNHNRRRLHRCKRLGRCLSQACMCTEIGLL